MTTSPSNKRVRLGFIGAGGMAAAHLHGLGNPELFPDVELVAFCDLVLERARAQATPFGAPAFDSPAKMIAEVELDGCYILLPPFAHGDAERACLEGNVPFFVEKPIGLDGALCREIKEEVARRDLLTSTGYMLRYQPSVQAAKAAFAGERAAIAYGGWFDPPPLTSHPDFAAGLINRWWSHKEKSGGQMVEQVTHTVDLARYFLGDAVEVYAHATHAFNTERPDIAPGYNIADAMTTSICFQSGAIASLMSSVASTATDSIFLDIWGTRTLAKFTQWQHHLELVSQGEEPRRVEGTVDIFAREDRAFVDALKSGDRSLVLIPYADAYKTLLLTLAANRSAETGKPVDLTT